MPAKLLVADDSTTIQKVFERTFPREEFALTFANTGEEALAKARQDKPNLIIADINMPMKNGFEICEEARKDPLLKYTPILLLVGILDDFDEDEARRVGADGFIVKPFEANAAINKVRAALAQEKTAALLKEPVRGQAEEIVELADMVESPAAGPPPQAQKVEEILELGDMVESPAAGPPPQERQAEDILELGDIVESPAAVPPPPQEKKEEGFTIQTSLSELEAELQKEFGEEKEEPLSLDLPLDEMETEPIVKGAEGTGLFGELGIGEGEEKEIRDERLEDILGKSATELEKIEDLTPKEEEKGPKKEEKFEEKFMDTFEPVFEVNEEGLKKIGAPEKDMEEDLKKAVKGLAERLATALGHELRKVTDEELEKAVPKLVRKEIEKLLKG